jgi:hypothetical protein
MENRTLGDWDLSGIFKKRKPTVSDLKFPTKIKTQDNLNGYLHSTRQIGHTRTLAKALKNVDSPFYLVSGTMKHSRDLCKEIRNPNAKPMSPELIAKEFPDTPVILDNFAYMNMCEIYDSKLAALYSDCRKLVRKVEEYHMEEVISVKDTMSYQARLMVTLRGELESEKKKSQHYKERMNKEKEKKAYYKKDKQEFLNNLTLFQRIFKKVK